VVFVHARRTAVELQKLPTKTAEHYLLLVCGGNDSSLPVHYFRWLGTLKFWKASYEKTGVTTEKTNYGDDKNSTLDFRQWRLLIYVRTGSVTSISDSLTESLGGQNKMWCELHQLYLVKRGRLCAAVCCVRHCDRIARWSCTAKGDTCMNAVCQAHGHDLLKSVGRVNVDADMDGRRLPGQQQRGQDSADICMEDEDTISDDDERNTEILASIGIEDPAGNDEYSALHLRKDIIPIYDVNSSGVPGHYLWNKGYGVMRRRMHNYANMASSSMMQHIVSVTGDACVSLLYPEAQLFPRIFWNSSNSSVFGAIPSFMLNCAQKSTDFGLASLQEHHDIRIRDGDMLTSKENAYWHYMFDVMLNSQLNHCSSKLVFKRGLEFLQEEKTANRMPSNPCTMESKLPMDEAESTRRIKELASLLKKGKWTYFVTLNVNDAKTPGVREITRAIRKVAAGDGVQMQQLVDAYLPFTLRCWERFVRVLLQELIMRNKNIFGKVKDLFYRFEFQGAGAKGNKPHVHAGITIEGENDEISVRRICCSSLEFSSACFGTDFESLLKLGVFSDKSEYETWRRIVDSVQMHDCERSGGRCMKSTNAQGEKICRYHRQPPCPLGRVSGWFEEMQPPYTEEVFKILQYFGLAEQHSTDGVQLQYHGNTWSLDETLACGKWHYFARSNEFFLASIPLLSAITRSSTNVDMCDRHFQVSYLVKYISGKEEHQLVDVAGSKQITDVTITTEEHAHEKISGCNKLLQAKEKIKAHLGREMSLAEIVWFVLGFPYTFCTAQFVHVPTLPLDSRAAVFKSRRLLGSVVENRKVAGLPSWRQFTDAQEAHIEECSKSCLSIDRTSAFNIRPPELMIFNNLEIYNECFTTSNLRSSATLSTDISDHPFIDGAGRAVQIWSCSIDKCSTFLQQIATSGSAVAQQLLDKILLPIQRGCPLMTQRFVKRTVATQIVAVTSFVKPWDRPTFLTHLCLSQGRYLTELDLFGHGSMMTALYTAGMLAAPDRMSTDDV
jgi:hypothetical protein